MHAFINVEEYKDLRFHGNALTFSSDGIVDGFKTPVVSPLTKSTVNSQLYLVIYNVFKVFGYHGNDKRNVMLFGDQLHVILIF